MSQNENLNQSIRAWPKADRPREKLFREGEHKLSNAELLAILLRSGTKGQSAVDIARKIIQKFKTFRGMSHTAPAGWKEFKGLGTAKIAQIKAAIEIGRRFREEDLEEEEIRISSSKDAADILMHRMRDLKKEVFKILLLNSQNKIIDISEAAEGTVNSADPIIREIFQKAIENFAASLICVHNHPSGNPQPSREDEEFTKKLMKAGNILQVKIVDHIIIGYGAYYSFSDKGNILGEKVIISRTH